MTASSPLSALHPASLVDPAEHSTALLDMLGLSINPNLINYIIQSTVDAVDFAMSRPSSSRPSTSRSYAAKYAPFADFVANVLYRSEVKTPVLFVALVYISRAKPHLSISLEQWACERVFLGALILAAKYSNDSTLKNVHWALCTGVFGKRDIGRIEREFLEVLDWDLNITEADILFHHDVIASLYPSQTPKHRQSTAAQTKRPRVVRDEDVTLCSDDSDDSSSSSSSSSSSCSSSPSSSSFDESHLAEEPASKRQKSDVPSSLPQRPMRPKSDAALPSALEILKAFPLPTSWGLSTGDSISQPSCLVPGTQIWV